MAYETEGTREWVNESEFLEAKTGEDIVKKQMEINSSPFMFIVATQIFPRKELTLEGQYFEKRDTKGHLLYDAFIYYKVKSVYRKVNSNFKGDGDPYYLPNGANITNQKPGQALDLSGAKL